MRKFSMLLAAGCLLATSSLSFAARGELKPLPANTLSNGKLTLVKPIKLNHFLNVNVNGRLMPLKIRSMCLHQPRRGSSILMIAFRDNIHSSIKMKNIWPKALRPTSMRLCRPF